MAKWSFSTLVVLSVAASGLLAEEPAVIFGPTMGTGWSIKLSGAPDDLDLAALKREVVAYLEEFDRKVSTYREDSEVSRFNASRETGWFGVSEETAQLLQLSLDAAAASEGAFDPTIAPLTRLWKFDRHEGLTELPAESDISAAREQVGFRRLEVRLDPPGMKKQIPELELNLNAVAPGWAVDRLVEQLEARGLHNYLVDVGSEIRAGGRKSDGGSWRVGIERPADDDHVLQAAIPLDDIAVATSGDYRNFYVVDGQRLSHTIDPRTGRPVSHGLASVTVLSANCASADALATAISVLGPDEGLDFANRRELPVWMMVRGSEGTLSVRASEAFAGGVGRELEDFAGQLETDEAGEPSPMMTVNSTLDEPIPASSESSPWLVMVLTLGTFLLASIGLAAGLILRGQSLKGSCGGLAGLKDEQGHPMCGSCGIPPEQCDEFREGVRQAAAGEDGRQPEPRPTE